MLDHAPSPVGPQAAAERSPSQGSDDPPPEPPDGSNGDGSSGPPKSVPLPVVGAIAGVIVGLGVVAVLALAGRFEIQRPPPEAHEELIAAYERHRNATFAFEGTFTRTMPDGRQLQSGAFVVQRPPDELRRQLGSTSGRLQGRRVNCGNGPDGELHCAPGAEVVPWEEMVATELANLRSYFDPAAPVYRAERVGSDCFELQLLAPLVDPPYGVRAVLCFDPLTGAMRSIEIEHETGAVDRLEADAVRSAVTNEDFGLEGQERFDAGSGG